MTSGLWALCSSFRFVFSSKICNKLLCVSAVDKKTRTACAVCCKACRLLFSFRFVWLYRVFRCHMFVRRNMLILRGLTHKYRLFFSEKKDKATSTPFTLLDTLSYRFIEGHKNTLTTQNGVTTLMVYLKLLRAQLSRANKRRNGAMYTFYSFIIIAFLSHKDTARLIRLPFESLYMLHAPFLYHFVPDVVTWSVFVETLLWMIYPGLQEQCRKGLQKTLHLLYKTKRYMYIFL